MHIEGQGTVEHLASSVRLLYDKVREFRTAHPTAADSFLKPTLPDISTITADPLNKIFGSSGEVNKGMIKFTFGRPAKKHGVTIDSTMGVNTGAHLPVVMRMRWLMETSLSRKTTCDRL